MSKGGAIAIGLLIEKFQEFLENLFEPKKKTKLEELYELDSIIKANFTISVLEITEERFEEVSSKLNPIDIQTLDKIIVLTYSCVNSVQKSELIERLKKNESLNKRLLDLIQFAENKSNILSLERNNIKNSLQHQLKERDVY
ncbi:hypothetical protein [Flavobacterium sp. 9AF]|uniref:hypothetical protein n=1 Tax=Flavobacterium sp. 9AF TaxID=2653142 RepID=UPI0013591741|nr:hypothetical protein [Flavobacterium sp. 9AF]